MRYDFSKDHGEGGSDHTVGKVHRLRGFMLTRVPGEQIKLVGAETAGGVGAGVDLDASSLVNTVSFSFGCVEVFIIGVGDFTFYFAVWKVESGMVFPDAKSFVHDFLSNRVSLLQYLEGSLSCASVASSSLPSLPTP